MSVCRSRISGVITSARVASPATRRAAVSAEAASADRTARLSLINGKLAALQNRIAIARVIDPAKLNVEEVRFGARVSVRVLTGPDSGKERTFSIVGVDQAQGRPGQVAFLAPIARAVTGKRAGESVSLDTPRGKESLEIVSVHYGA